MKKIVVEGMKLEVGGVEVGTVADFDPGDAQSPPKLPERTPNMISFSFNSRFEAGAAQRLYDYFKAQEAYGRSATQLSRYFGVYTTFNGAKPDRAALWGA